MFDPDKYYAELEQNVKEIREITDFVPEVALVLGSGLKPISKTSQPVAEISYSQLSNFPIATNKSHDGKFVLTRAHDTNIICMKGRVHYYEGYPMHDVVKPIRLMKMLGAKTVIITNAVGAINPFFHVGEFVSVRDHISLFSPSPLIGPTIKQLGADFVDMTNIYDSEINHVLYEIARDNHVALRNGIYLQVTGRQFESPAETKLLHSLGADIVAMSATNEAIVARHMGMRICQISVITNMAGGLQEKVSDEEVKDAASKLNKDLGILIRGILEFLKNERSLNKQLDRFRKAD